MSSSAFINLIRTVYVEMMIVDKCLRGIFSVLWASIL